MSFSMTTEAIRNRTKTVTRRLGWDCLMPGDLLWACEKCMGLKKGEKVKKLALIRVVDRWWEDLEQLHYWDRDGREMEREGFPGMDPENFIEMFCRANRTSRYNAVNRIEFEYVEVEDV
jgi:hypothetical protein